MQIPLVIQKWAGGKRPFLFGIIRQSKFPLYGQIRFIIDTGSPFSIISGLNAKRWRIPYGKLGNPISIRGMGKGKILGYPMSDVKLSIKDSDNNLTILQISKIHFIQSETLPNVLGENFLTENRLTLHYNPSEGYAFLEKK